EVHVVDADVADAAVAVLAAPAVYQVNQRIADPLDGRDVQLHGAAMRVKAPGAQLQGALVGAGGILHAKANRTDRRAMQPREALRERIRLGVDQEVHAALAIQRHVFMAMPGYRLEAQRLEYL